MPNAVRRLKFKEVGYPQNLQKFDVWIFTYSDSHIFSTYFKRSRTLKFQKLAKLQPKMGEPAHESGCRGVTVRRQALGRKVPAELTALGDQGFSVFDDHFMTAIFMKKFALLPSTVFRKPSSEQRIFRAILESLSFSI